MKIALGKGRSIIYLCPSHLVCDEMVHKILDVYMDYNLKRIALHEISMPNGQRIKLVSLNTNRAYDRVIGFQGPVLEHPGCYESPQWKSDRGLQDAVIQCNIRNQPWPRS